MRNTILILCLLLLLPSSILVLGATEANKHDRYSVSTLYLGMFNKKPFIVVVDDYQFTPNGDNIVAIEGIKPGKHLVKVLQSTPKGDVPRFYGTIDIAPQKLIYAYIDEQNKFKVFKEFSMTTVEYTTPNLPLLDCWTAACFSSNNSTCSDSYLLPQQDKQYC